MSEIDGAFPTIAQSDAGGLLVGSGPFFTRQRERPTAASASRPSSRRSCSKISPRPNSLTARRYGGTGLGLALAQARAHDGRRHHGVERAGQGFGVHRAAAERAALIPASGLVGTNLGQFVSRHRFLLADGAEVFEHEHPQRRRQIALDPLACDGVEES